ncbi:serine/threonine-protein kinase [Nonomuraea sp. NPDC003560]|uniref:serine/threonine-protein kinase n=1 Tax=Nonomuraea sp. NPDC003560 TaxID=3364341 RepID=UPI00368A8A54
MIGGRYRLESVLGGGGFGRVWKAHDESLDVSVAVKEVWLPSATSDEEHAQRLRRAEREARNAARLRSHPHIVTVHDVVIEDQAPWIVMELVDGGTLAELIARDGPLPPGVVASAARGLLDALRTAHASGIVHRDVKPANVLIARDGRVLLTDFGIAVQQGDTALTKSGGLMGSLEYIAPERFNGVDSGGAGDLYSLGVTLYQALEGVSPFHRDTPTETLTAVLLGEPPVPRDAGGLGTLITRLLDKAPANRPTAAEALAMIDALGQPRLPNTPPPPAGPQSVPPRLPFPDAGSAPSGPSARTENLPPPPPPTLQEQAPAFHDPSRPGRSGTGPGGPRNRKLLIAGGAGLAVVIAAVAVVVAVSGDGDQTPQAGSSGTAAEQTAAAADQPGTKGHGIPPGCENQTGVMEKWTQVPVSGTVPLPPTENLLNEIIDLQQANLAKAVRPALKTALRNDIDTAKKALKALRADDVDTYRQAVTKDKLGHLTEISDACFFNDLGPSQSSG